MSRIPRFAGYALMAVAAAIAVLMREGKVAAIGPVPALVAVLAAGMIGAMLVFTDLMVRGLYAQVDAAERSEGEGE